MQTTRRTIEGGWRVREVSEKEGFTTGVDWIPAQVPGHVHLDLQRAGVIADPFHRLQERSCAWVDETDWEYETTFVVEEPPACAYLQFHGLDTVAEIMLNGEELGRIDNMFISHEFPVGGRLMAGENTLRVVFRSALRVGRERLAAWEVAGNPAMPPHWFTWGPRSFVRKAQYMYGWDWGPELVSCGIWRPVELVTVPVARLLDWRYDTEFTDDGKAVVTVTAEVERAPGHEETPLTLRADLLGVHADCDNFDDALPGGIVAEVSFDTAPAQVHLSLIVENPRRWVPNGYNSPIVAHPPMYDLHLSLIASDVDLDARDAAIGLRTVELVREPDADGQGESFRFRINGVDVFCKGANWIPADSFLSRLEHESGYTNVQFEERSNQVRELITMACDAGINMLRVWGGGLYESEHFYELCDEHGIMVWQDFPYGCAYYPDTGEYADAARREATAAVRRIRKHPSLALWCGNNENQMFYDGYRRREDAPPFLGERLYDDVLPAVVRAEDPKTPYWPGSPFGGPQANSPDYGDSHNWSVWHGVGDWTHYPEDDSRFVSEFGFASSCGMTAWDGCLDPTDRWPRSPAVRWHDKTKKGYDTYLGYIRLHFPEPQTLEDLVYFSQLNQAEALKCGVEHYRRRKGRCWGTLFWQLNDCWPAQSWAVVDYALEPKAACYAAKRFYAPLLLSLVRNGDTVEAYLTNDLVEHVQGDVTLSVESFDGDVLASETAEALVDANGTAQVAALDVSAFRVHARDVYVHARFEPYWDLPVWQPVENLLFLAEPKDLRLPDPGLTMTVEDRSEGGYERMEVVLTARRFTPYVWVRVEGGTRLSDHPRDDNFFHLRAGETKRLLIARDDTMHTLEDARGRLRLRSL